MEELRDINHFLLQSFWASKAWMVEEQVQAMEKEGTFKSCKYFTMFIYYESIQFYSQLLFNIFPSSFMLSQNWQAIRSNLHLLKTILQDSRKDFVVIFACMKEIQGAARKTIKELHQNSRLQEVFTSLPPFLKLHERRFKILGLL